MRTLRSPSVVAFMVGIFALIGLLVYGVLQERSGGAIDKSLAAGARPQAADRQFRDLFGSETRTINDYRGRLVVLNFWASWCDPCRDESPALERAWQKYRHRGLVVIGADVDDTRSDAQKFINEFNLTYPMVRYSSGDAGRDYGTKALPETFVIDRAGRIAKAFRGPVDDQTLKAAIEPLL